MDDVLNDVIVVIVIFVGLLRLTSCSFFDPFQAFLLLPMMAMMTVLPSLLMILNPLQERLLMMISQGRRYLLLMQGPLLMATFLRGWP